MCVRASLVPRELRRSSLTESRRSEVTPIATSASLGIDRKTNFPSCKVLLGLYGFGTRSSTFPTKRASESERKGGPSHGSEGIRRPRKWRRRRRRSRRRKGRMNKERTSVRGGRADGVGGDGEYAALSWSSIRARVARPPEPQILAASPPCFPSVRAPVPRPGLPAPPRAAFTWAGERKNRVRATRITAADAAG